MFDIDVAIVRWKESVASCDSVAIGDAEELELHLRELISELRKHDLSDQEAFMIATRRLGSVSELQDEFAKVNGATIWQKRVLWMVCGYIAFNVGSAVVQASAAVASTGVALIGTGPQVTGATTIGVLAIGWMALFAIAYWVSKTPSAGADRIPISWCVVAGIALVLAHGIRQGGTILRAHAVGVSEFGESALWQVYGGVFVHLSVFFVSVFLVWKLSERKSEPSGTVT